MSKREYQPGQKTDGGFCSGGRRVWGQICRGLEKGPNPNSLIPPDMPRFALLQSSEMVIGLVFEWSAERLLARATYSSVSLSKCGLSVGALGPGGAL